MQVSNYLRHLLKSLVRYIFRGTKKRKKFDALVFLEKYGSDVTSLKPNVLAIVGPPGKFKWLQLVCPCGCDRIIAMNLMKKYHPNWTIEIHGDDTITVFPSIHASNCGAHFWVRRNLVEWC